MPSGPLASMANLVKSYVAVVFVLWNSSSFVVVLDQKNLPETPLFDFQMDYSVGGIVDSSHDISESPSVVTVGDSEMHILEPLSKHHCWWW